MHLVVDRDAVCKRIVAGILEHRSQLHVMADEYRLQRIVRREWATVAWPPRSPTGPVLTDVFEDL